MARVLSNGVDPTLPVERLKQSRISVSELRALAVADALLFYWSCYTFLKKGFLRPLIVNFANILEGYSVDTLTEFKSLRT